ncbi:MAG: sigma-70 family RNA polymerase sigma factor [Bacteroidetes bacterium]|nr:sigma-70 family RNA polymerase sigma factor [Bacteroidota bacterium]
MQKKASEGNKIDVFSGWVNDYSEDLVRWAYFKTNDQHIAEDLVQETFISAYKSLDRFKNESKPKTWLYAILNNKIIDHHRKQFKSVILTQTQIEKEEDSINLLEKLFEKNGSWRKNKRPAEWEEEPEHLLDDMEFKNILQNCLEELPEKWFSVIHLKFLEEKNGADICKDLKITPSNFWQLLHRAKLQLRECLENRWFKSKQ